MRIRRFIKRGFTLVELMIVVAIIGVLAALAIYGVRKYLANAKTSEAKNTLGAISRGAVAAYERESAPAELMVAGGTSSGAMHQLCASTKAAVPDVATKVQNKKYTPTPTDYATTEWRCLKFELLEPQYYQYNYVQGAAAKIATNLTKLPSANGYIAEAVGDLNGDSVYSNFGLVGDINTAKQIVTATQVEEYQAEE